MYGHLRYGTAHACFLTSVSTSIRLSAAASVSAAASASASASDIKIVECSSRERFAWVLGYRKMDLKCPTNAVLNVQRRSLELTVPRLPISPMTSLSSLVGPYSTGIVRLVLDEMFSAIIRSIRVTAAVMPCNESCEFCI
jgi:hypothetical protein